jgi:molecular chaperone GrpE
VTKRRKSERDEALSPLDEEMAQAAPADAAADHPVSASAEEVAAASIFTDEAAGTEAPPAAGPVSAALQAELAELKAKADEYLDGWQRSRAEFANYKKRIERDQDEARGRAAAALLAKILPIEDDLLRAVRERPPGDGEALRSWSEGIELIQRKLAGLLEAEGVAVIEAEGAVFDPALHEAVTYEASDDHNEGQIIEVIQPGYRLGERILRPARVRVAR